MNACEREKKTTSLSLPFRHNFPCNIALFQTCSLDEPVSFRGYTDTFVQVMKAREDKDDLYRIFRSVNDVFLSKYHGTYNSVYAWPCWEET